MSRESGSSRAVVVHSFAEPRRARLVPRWLSHRGYRAVPFGAPAPVGAPLVHLGDVAHALALSRVAAHLRSRVEGLAIVGGSLSVVLDASDGLGVPTLVVHDDVPRLIRRRALRRLPRGSQVVRARDFEAALRAAMEFFDERVGAARGRRRSLIARVAPAIVLSAPAAALFAGPGVGVAGAVCAGTYDDETDVISVSCDGDGGANLKIWASTAGDVYVNDANLAPLSEVSSINVTMTGFDDTLLIDETQQKLQTLLKFDLGDGTDTLSWTASAGDDAFKIGAGLINVGGVDQKVFGVETIKFDLGAGDDFVDGGDWSAKLVLDGGDGLDQLKIVSETSLITIDDSSVTVNDSVSGYKQFETLDVLGGGDNSLKIISDGLSSKISDDKVELPGSEISYAGFAKLTYVGSAGADVADLVGIKFQKLDLDLGEGFDTLKLAADDKQIKLTDAILELGDTANVIEHKGVNSFDYLGGAGDNAVDVFVKFLAVALDGGAGDDQVKISGDDALVTLSDSQVKLTDSTVAYKDFALLSYIGGEGESKIDLSGLNAQKVALDGGGGLDEIKLSTDAAFVGISDSLIKFSAAEASLVGLESLVYLGGPSANTIEAADFSKLKLALDGGGGDDLLKIASDDSLIKISDSLVELTDAGAELKFTDFQVLGVEGGTSANKIDVKLADFLNKLKLQIDGGGGADDLKIKYDSEIKMTTSTIDLVDKLSIDYLNMESFELVGGEANSKIEVLGTSFQKLAFAGGGGDDLLNIASDDSLIKISDSLVELTDAGTELKFTDFEVLDVDGGTSANKIDVKLADYLNKLKLEVDGGGGTDDLKIKYDSEIKMTTSTIDLVDKLSIDYLNMESFELAGGDANSKIDIVGTSFQKLTLDGGGGDDLLKIASDASLIEITDSKLFFDSQHKIDHTSFETLAAVGGTSANKIDAALVTQLKVDLEGGAGNDVLIGGGFDDKLTGGLGDDKLTGNGGIDLVYEQGDVNFIATNSSLSGLGADTFATIERLHLDGGSKDNILDASAFKLGAVILDGGASDDVLIGSPASDTLLGNIGDDRIVGNQGNDSIFAGDGDDYLDGSQGTDFGDGGAGIDTGKSIETRVNIER